MMMLKSYYTMSVNSKNYDLPDEPFSVLLCCDGTWDEDRAARICATLKDAGCRFFNSVGKHHMKWHVACDDAAGEDMLTVSGKRINEDAVYSWAQMSCGAGGHLTCGVILCENETQRRRIENCLTCRTLSA